MDDIKNFYSVQSVKKRLDKEQIIISDILKRKVYEKIDIFVESQTDHARECHSHKPEDCTPNIIVSAQGFDSTVVLTVKKYFEKLGWKVKILNNETANADGTVNLCLTY